MARIHHPRRQRPLALEQLEDRCLLSYAVTDLGTLGGDFSEARGLNAFGDVAGLSQTATFPHPYHAFRYHDGSLDDLDTLGSTYSSGDAINDAGQVAGSVFVSGVNTHAFLFSGDGPMQDLGTLGGDTSAAFGLNNRGWVVGQAAVTGTYLTHAFLYRFGHMIDLGALGGADVRSAALGVNGVGWVVGGSEAPGGFRAFLWRHGHMLDLGTLGGSVSNATAVNDFGQVAGDSDLATDSGFFPHHAFLWESGVMVDLGTLGGFYSYAYGLNNSGQVVGYAALPDNTSAPFLYADGVMTNLNDLIGTDWKLSRANAINDAGQIVGYGSNAKGEQHALLLSPDASPRPQAQRRLDSWVELSLVPRSPLTTTTLRPASPTNSWRANSVQVTVAEIGNAPVAPREASTARLSASTEPHVKDGAVTVLDVEQFLWLDAT